MMFRNYLYVSGTAQTLKKYFQDFVALVEFRHPNKTLRVLEIASNDGTLLEVFKSRGHQVLGVDPAKNLLPLSIKNGVETIPEFWNREIADTLIDKFDIVIGMNVFAHISDPRSFMENCLQVLKDDGEIYIQTSQSEIFRRFEFDTIYHEHHSFFTVRSFKTLIARTGGTFFRCEKVPVHGSSYLFTVKKHSMTIDPSVPSWEAQENDWGFYNQSTYETFSNKVKESAQCVREVILECQNKGMTVIGYGAAAKGNTFLNYAKIDLKYIVDDNPLKIGLLTPGMNIPIQSIEQIRKEQNPIATLVLAWNFFEEICKRILDIRNNASDIAITYFPEVKKTHLTTNESTGTAKVA